MTDKTEEEFKATMVQPMRRLEPTGVPALNLGPYVDAIPVQDFQGHDFSSRFVPHVYATPDGHFEHVLISASVPNVFLVVVVDTRSEQVRGHHLLDLKAAYGLSDSESSN